MDQKAIDFLNAIKEQGDQNLELNIKASSKVSMSPEECKALCTKIGLQYKAGYENRVVQFRFTDSSADCHNEVVIAKGVDLKSYLKDPMVLLQHDSWKFPIGKSLETKYDEKYDDVVGKVLFFDDEVDRTGMSESTFRMVEAGALKSGSIGFRASPENIRFASPEERTKYKLSNFGIVFDKIELREYSIVTIPANPNATQIAARKGCYTKEALDTLKLKGATDETLAMLKKDEEPGSSPENQNSVKDVKNTINYVVNISDDLGKEIKENKLAFAEKMASEGHNVTVNISTETEIKAGAVLSKKNKSIIKSTIEGIEKLKGDLETLLAMTNTETDEGKSTGSVHNDSETENNSVDIYSLVELLDKKINKK